MCESIRQETKRIFPMTMITFVEYHSFRKVGLASPFTFLFYRERQKRADQSIRNLLNHRDDTDLRFQMTLVLEGRLCAVVPFDS